MNHDDDVGCFGVPDAHGPREEAREQEWRRRYETARSAAPAEGVQPVAPSEQQIIDAAEEAGLWPNTVRTWLAAFHRYHAALNRALANPQAEAAGVPAPDERVNVPYCLACQKEGHRTTECWSTHGLNTPADWELHRLRGEAALAASRDSQAPAAPLPDFSPEAVAKAFDEAASPHSVMHRVCRDYFDQGVAFARAALSRPQAEQADWTLQTR